MKKIICVALSIIILFSLVSCNREIPEGDIKNFVNNLSYEKAYEYVKTGYSSVTATHVINEVVDGTITYETNVDTIDAYYFRDTVLTGSYYGTAEDQFNYYNETILAYSLEEEIVSLKKTDGTVSNTDYQEEQLSSDIASFFYTKEESGYHTGGMYYGDDVIINCADYYNFFSLNEEKTELTYKINSLRKVEDNRNIITIHEFTINNFGMLIKLTSKSFYEDDVENQNIKTYFETSVSCIYNQEVNKIYSFE